MSSTLKQQLGEFSESVRSGMPLKNSNLNAEKTALYHALVMGNLQEVISPCFPILRSIICRHTWSGFMLDFFQQRPLNTPLFHQLPFEFVTYLQNLPSKEYPFMADLAHYEWVELALELAASVNNIKRVVASQILETHWQLSSCAKLLSYEYDVYNIGSNYIPHQTIPTYLAVYKKDNAVEFMVLNELSFQLLECIIDSLQTPHEVLESLVEMYPNLDLEQLASQIQPLIYKLHQESILLAA